LNEWPVFPMRMVTRCTAPYFKKFGEVKPVMLKVNKVIALLIIIGLVMGLTVGCGGGGSQTPSSSGDNSGNAADAAKPSMNLKVGHVLAPDHPYQLGLEKFAELVAERTDGRIKIDVFHSSQLGGEREMIEGLQLGTLDMTIVFTAPLAGFANSFLVFDLPFIFQERDKAYQVLDGQIGTDILNTLESVGIKGLCYWENGFRHVTNSKVPITEPEDMKGMKIRTMENKIHMASFRTIGADPTPMAFGELFTALQQKTVDAQENPIPIIYTSNFYEVQDYLSLTGHFYAAAPLLMSKSLWNSLSAEDQEIIMSCALEARDYERSLIRQMDEECLDMLKEKGMQVIEVGKDKWFAAMQPVYDQFKAEIGEDVIQRVLDAQK